MAAESTQSYKCANCGAPVKYQPGAGSLYCEYCKGYTKINQEKPAQKKSPKKNATDLETTTVVRCHQCKAVYERSKYPDAEHCIFCGERIYSEDIHEEYVWKPSYILPFEITEEEFLNDVELWSTKKRKMAQSPFYRNGKKIKDIYVNKIYLPCIVSDMSVPTDKQQLSNPRFEYKNIFEPANNYTFGVLNHSKLKIKPFDRMKLIPIQDGFIGDSKVQLASLAPGGKYKNLEEALLGELRKYIVSDPAPQMDVVDLVLVPVYEYKYKFKNSVFSIYGNGSKGGIIGAYPVIGPVNCLALLLFIIIIGALVALIFS